MKLAFFIFSLDGGGAERITSYLANYWASENHDIVIFTLKPPTGIDYPTHQNVKRITLISENKYKGPFGPSLNAMNRILTLRSELKKHKPDFVISMMTKASVIAAPTCRSLNIPCICAERNDPSVTYSGTIWHLLRKIAYRFADSVVVQSNKANTWISENTYAQRVMTIPNPVIHPLQDFPPFINTEPFTAKRTFIAVGRLSHQKQFCHAIEAFAELHHRYPKWQFIILGEGREREMLEKTIVDLDMCAHIHLPGRAGNMNDWYGMADALVLSSLHEGFPNVLVEAMSHGLAVVSYDCDTGPKDIISDEQDGLLVPAGDRVKLALSMERIMADENFRSALSQAAIKVKKKYSLDSISTQWESLLTTQR